MSEGLLRDSVLVLERDESVTLSHPCWALELPLAWVRDTPGVLEFLRRQAPMDFGASAEAADLAALLAAQGCLTSAADKPAYRMREIFTLFHGIRNEWCGHYYRHPIWDALRAGMLSRARFTAWAVYNYFLSRSAGISAARFVAFSPRPELRPSMAHSMIEEYSHFAEYYHLQHADLPVSPEEIEQYVQLPSSTAFCQQMLRMAEEDWLGHLLIAYFQESTVEFHKDCFEFYRNVEEKYDLPGFFKPWCDHIKVDIDCLHAESVEELFSSDELVEIADLRRSLANAWFTFRSLLTALDELCSGVAEVDGEWRRPPYQRVSDPAAPIWLFANRWPTVARLPENTPLLKIGQLCRIPAPESADRESKRYASQDSAFLRSDILRSLYRALSFADDAELILLFGRLVEGASGQSLAAPIDLRWPTVPETAEALAIANFLRELAIAPRQFATAFYCLCDTGADGRWWLPVGSASQALLAEYLAGQVVDNAAPLVTKLAQLTELVERWEAPPALPGMPNFFTGAGLAVA